MTTSSLMYRYGETRPDGHTLTFNDADTYVGQFVGGDVFAGGLFNPVGNRYEHGFIEGHQLEVHSEPGSHVLKVAGEGLKNCSCSTLDLSWLRGAAKAYEISPSIKDYVIVEVPCVVANYPNRNMDSFPYSELMEWRIPMSRYAYQTFIGKPAHTNHNNQDPKQAKGVILDAVLTPVLGKLHVKLLKAFDRSKDPQLADNIQKAKMVGHSMGALVERTVCSLPWCGFESDGRQTCEHIAGGEGKGRIINGHLVYEDMKDFFFIESSLIENGDMASVSAITDVIHT